MDKLFNPQEVHIKSIKEFVERIETLVNKDDEKRYYFRGHFEKDWSLIPSIARLKDIKYIGIKIPENISSEVNIEIEKEIFHKFRRHTYVYGKHISKWESLFLAQHHKLPTRLMDWSTNPLVALYFATFFEDEEKDHGVVWWFARKKNENNKKDVEIFQDDINDKDEDGKNEKRYKDPFEIEGVRLIYPFFHTPKIIAQSSVFTIHAPPWTDLKDYKKGDDSKDCDIKEGGCFIIESSIKQKLQESLYRFGINSLTLHLDLPNIAQGLKERLALEHIHAGMGNDNLKK